ncbi:g2 mitotic-specific cyclin-b [Moniliophthora roreri MCA 2997]|uniref:G2 mitotic-specific cyclin-b n=1 Tax=Moniliophthora roreri (strain MCA 2997) TaxID=1381753 RepID=V2X5F0_MONRO|nr:g2 mitotic-specific cyclin-b [Moniliophthora roreri MCA 2997]
MATNHIRQMPQRVRTGAQRGKADENATAKHLRQPSSGIALPARIIQKDVGGPKATLIRPALGEVTTTAVNRKDNKNNGKEKEEVGLKRGRSDSSANAVQRVPLGPGRSQAAPPVANVVPIRAPLSRATRPLALNNTRQLSRAATGAFVVHEDALAANDQEDVEMDVEDLPITSQTEEVQPPSERVVETAPIQIHEDIEDEMNVVDDIDSDDEVQEENEPQQTKSPRVWPDMATEHRLRCERDVQAIREVFDDGEEPFDPTMVSDYAEEIFEYMESLEASMMPKANYMEAQTELTWQMRSMLVDWLIQIHLKYHMLPETLWIAINIMDRFLSERVVSTIKLQLVGVTAMLIAAKYEEIMAPSVEEFVFMTEQAYTKDEILKGERIILQCLDFQISHYCSPYSWMRRISKADDYDLQTRTLGKFLIEVTLLDHRFLRAKSSLVAAVGMYSARTMLGGDWNDAFVFHSGYTEEQLLPGHQLIVEKLAERSFPKLYLWKKYSNKKFLKASTFAVKWARNQLSGLSDDEAQS